MGGLLTTEHSDHTEKCRRRLKDRIRAMAHAKPRRREGGVWWGWAMQRPLVVGGVFLLSSLFKTSRLRANKSATVLKPGAFPSITIYLMNNTIYALK